MQPALRLLILLACAGIIASLFTHPFACSAGGYLWVASVSLIALCAMLAQRRAPASPEVAGPSAEGLDAVQAALVSYRAGVQVRARCPNCRSVLLLRRSQTRSAAGAGCVDVACACRTCDGTYEVRAARRA